MKNGGSEIEQTEWRDVIGPAYNDNYPIARPLAPVKAADGGFGMRAASPSTGGVRVIVGGQLGDTIYFL